MARAKQIFQEVLGELETVVGAWCLPWRPRIRGSEVKRVSKALEEGRSPWSAGSVYDLIKAGIVMAAMGVTAVNALDRSKTSVIVGRNAKGKGRKEKTE